MKRISFWMSVRFLICMTLLIAATSIAGNRSGTVSEQFLKICTNARAIGIGDAGVAVAEGVSSIPFNPAGIMAVDNIGVGLTYTAWFANIQHCYAGVVKNFPGIGAVGVGLVMLATDDMAETTPQYPEGTGRYFRASDFALSLAYARQVTDQFQVGLSSKVIKSYLYNSEVSASSFAFDIGTLYYIPILRSHMGVSLTNIGKDVIFLQETYSLPTTLRFGIAVDAIKDESNQLIATIQICRRNDADEQYNIGVEYTFNNFFSLRGGRKFAYDQEDWAGGFGLKLNSIGLNGTLDYAYNNFKYLPGTHSFTFEVQF